MADTLYDEFRDPTAEFAREPRAFCYEVATDFIARAKQLSPPNWILNENTAKGVLLLLFTWNFAARETKRLNFENIGKLLMAARADLEALQQYTLQNVPEAGWERVERAFDAFRPVCGQTGASKALGLLNPQLFVMWDTAIRRRLNREIIQGIDEGKTGRQYVVFLKGVRRIIEEHGIAKKLPPGSNVAKKFDEYNYVRIVMHEDG